MYKTNYVKIDSQSGFKNINIDTLINALQSIYYIHSYGSESQLCHTIHHSIYTVSSPSSGLNYPISLFAREIKDLSDEHI